MRPVIKWKRKWRQNYQRSRPKRQRPPRSQATLWHHQTFPQMNDTTKYSKHVEIAKSGVPWESIKIPTQLPNAAQKLKTQTPLWNPCKGANADQVINIWTPPNYKVPEPEQSAHLIASNIGNESRMKNRKLHDLASRNR
jgi:hypothetical protein